MKSGAESTFGYPVSESVADAQGYVQEFRRGNFYQKITWAPNTGVNTINSRGGIHAKWISAGGAAKVGFPVTFEYSEYGGAVQFFRSKDGGESAIYWHPTVPTTLMNSKGALYYWWRNKGYIPRYGFPLHDERVEADGRTHLRFAGGLHLTWSAGEGVRVR